jgi:hypothetical protein
MQISIKETIETFAQALEHCAQEEILFAVIGPFGSYSGQEEEMGDKIYCIPPKRQRKVLSWTDAKSLLSYPYESSYAGIQCNAVYAWTENYVIFVTEYDGRTDIHRISRSPINCEPYII